MLDVKYVSWSASGTQPFVEVAPDLLFPREVMVTATNEPGMTVDLKLDVIFDELLDRYVVHRLSARRRGPGEDVTGQVLRTVRVQDVLRLALNGTIKIGRTADLSEDVTSEDLERMPLRVSPGVAAEIRRMGPSSDEALLWVARIYATAAALSSPPSKALQDQLGLAAPTASVWIRRARDRGLLRPPPMRNSDG